jgi:hypothetical protein
MEVIELQGADQVAILPGERDGVGGPSCPGESTEHMRVAVAACVHCPADVAANRARREGTIQQGALTERPSDWDEHTSDLSLRLRARDDHEHPDGVNAAITAVKQARPLGNSVSFPKIGGHIFGDHEGVGVGSGQRRSELLAKRIQIR